MPKSLDEDFLLARDGGTHTLFQQVFPEDQNLDGYDTAESG